MKPSNTWSPLSNVTVNLKPSSDYQKLLIVIYGIALVALWMSNIYWVFNLILILNLSIYCLYLSRQKTPGSSCVQIQYIQQQWRVYRSSVQFKQYQVVRIKFDFGWLMWLIFENKRETVPVSRQHVLLFYDQTTPDSHRLLRVLLRVLN